MSPKYMGVCVGVRGLWKQGITALFDVHLHNLYSGSYLFVMPENLLVKVETEKNIN